MPQIVFLAAQPAFFPTLVKYYPGPVAGTIEFRTENGLFFEIYTIEGLTTIGSGPDTEITGGIVRGFQQGRVVNGARAMHLEVTGLNFAATELDNTRATPGLDLLDLFYGANDTFTGSAFADEMNGLGGNDLMRGGAGNDTLYGGDGNDTLQGQAGADTMYGGAGNDVYLVSETTDVVVETANAGIDRVETTLAALTLGANLENLTLLGTNAAVIYRGDGNTANNVIIGSVAGVNALRGLAGNDLLRGGTQGDTLNGGAGNDTLEGLGGNDTLIGDSGNDAIYGGNGNDALYGGDGNDTLYGGNGNDIYYVTGTADVVIEAANAGIDRIETTQVSRVLGANLEDLTFTGTDAAATYRGDGNGLNNTIIGSAVAANALRGFDGADLLQGGALDDTLIGGLGSDTMIGGAGNDVYVVDNAGDLVTEATDAGIDRVNTTLTSLTLMDNVEDLTMLGTDTALTYRGDGNALNNRIIGTGVASNVLRGFVGNDVLRGGTLRDTLNGGSGSDTLEGLDGADLILGGLGNDRVFGGNGRDEIQGDDGNDTLDGGEAADVVSGGLGDDVISGGAGNDTLDGGEGQDTLTGGIGDDEVHGGGGNDRGIGSGGQDLLTGGDGDDWLQGDGGNDTLIGDAGNDTLQGGLGLDSLVGGDGADLLQGGGGADMLIGGTGNDTVLGGGGNDLINGDDGDDSLLGNAGDDVIYGGIGADSLGGGGGNDELHGDDGNDSLLGNAGDDVIYGGIGADSLDGGSGNDELHGDNGHDTLTGGAGNDSLFGGLADDVLFGGAGDDSLMGGDSKDILTDGEGTDTLRGEAGADTLIVVADAPGAAPRLGIYDGGEANDVIRLQASGDNRSANLSATEIVSVERLDFGVAAGGAKVITLSAGQISPTGLAQRALIVGTAGESTEDRLRIEMGTQTVLTLQSLRFGLWEIGTDSPGTDLIEVIGTSGNDIITGSIATDRLLGGQGDDLLIAGGGVDLVYGGSGNDTLVLTAKPGPFFNGEVLDGGAGDDRLRLSNGTLTGPATFNLREASLASLEAVDFQTIASAGAALMLDADQIGGGISANARILGNLLASGANSVQFMMGTATTLDLSGWLFNSWRFGVDQVSIRGAATDDIIIGSNVADLIEAQNGNDTVAGLDGNDALVGGGGDDLMFGGGGFNLLDGGLGNDTLISDNSVLDGMIDTLLGGEGSDWLILDSQVRGDISGVLDGGNGFDSLVIRAAAADARVDLFASTLVSLEALLLEGGSGNRVTAFMNYQVPGGFSTGLTIDARSSTASRETLEITVEGDLLTGGGVLDISGWIGQTTPGGAILTTRILSSNRASQIYGSTFDDFIDIDPNFGSPTAFISESGLVFGGAGNDTVMGGDLLGSDQIYGGDGDDVILAGAGSDVIYGDDGNDSIIAASMFDGGFIDDSPDVIYGGIGEDAISISFFAGGTFVYGGDDADTITVDNPTIGMGGAYLSADRGADLVIGGYGDDTLIAGQGRDTMYGSLGNDLLLGLDTSTGTSETGAEMDDIFRLFALLNGLITFEQVFGPDPFLFSDAAQDLRGEDGNDTLAGGRSGDVLFGGTGDDGIWGAGGDDLIEGNDGDDVIAGGFGNDVIYGGAGIDFIIGGLGSDTLFGGEGDDEFVFTDFSESRAGAVNRDVIGDFVQESDIIDLSGLSLPGFNIAMAYDTGEGIGFVPVGSYDFAREVVDVVLFTETVAEGVLVRAQHFDVFTAGLPDPGTADTNFEILVLGVTDLGLFNFDTGFILS